MHVICFSLYSQYFKFYYKIYDVLLSLLECFNLSFGIYCLALIAELLQTQDFRIDQEKEPCIRVNTRELDRELYTR